MPIQMYIHEVQRLVEIVFTGEVSSSEVLDALSRYLREPYSTLPLGMFDLSGVTVADISAEAIRSVAARTGQHVDTRLGQGKLAIVAPRDLLFGMARMYGILRDDSPVEVRVFREREEAESWLGLEQCVTQPSE